MANTKRPNFPLRQRTGTAHFHNSKAAVDFSLRNLDRMTPKEAVLLFANARWGSAKLMPCPHCGTIDSHYWHETEMRWKCKGCGKRFSVTSGTVLAGRKLPLLALAKIAHLWASGSSGKPAQELRRNYETAYSTMFTNLQKLREGLLRGANTGMLCGVQEIDGIDVNGRRYKEKRNRTRGSKGQPPPEFAEEYLAPVIPPKDFMGPPLPAKFRKSQKQPADRRIVMVIRQRGIGQGAGASKTIVGVALVENTENASTLAKSTASAESFIMTDEDNSYSAFSTYFAKHQTVCHSVTYSLPNGVHNNQAESYNARLRRSTEGIYLNPSNKYLMDYAVENAWREDVRRLSTGDKLQDLFHTALGVGVSKWWRGYTHGQHRKDEFLLEGPLPAEGRGKKPGRKPRLPR